MVMGHLTPPNSLPGSLPVFSPFYRGGGKNGKTGTCPKSPETGKTGKPVFIGLQQGGAILENGKLSSQSPKSTKTRNGNAPCDLLGNALILERKNAKPEAGALREVLQALNAHPAVAWCERMNSGAAKMGNRFVRFGWKGCPDVLGQLNDGRLLGVEVTAEKGKLRPEQTLFLERIRRAGGVAFMARDCRDVIRELDRTSGISDQYAQVRARG